MSQGAQLTPKDDALTPMRSRSSSWYGQTSPDPRGALFAGADTPQSSGGGAGAEEVSSLGDVESSLGDAKSSLGDAMSSLGDAKRSLGDVRARWVTLRARWVTLRARWGTR